MNNFQSTYCSLLQQAIGLSAPSLNAKRSALNGVDISSLVHLAQIQGTAPLIYNEILKSGENMASLKQVCMQNMLLQQEQKTILRTAWDALSKGGVKPVLLKGFGLADLYPQPYLRQWGDIDIYVGADGYHIAADTLRKTFPDSPCFEEEEEYFKHWNISIGNTAIEAHRVSAILIHPCDMRLWLRLECDAMAHAQQVDIEGMALRIPEYRFNTLFVFLHSWHHFTESGTATMKQLCDLALLLHSVPRSYLLPLTSYLRHHLRRLRLTQVWQAYAYIMVTYLGLPADQCPLYTPTAAKRGERFMQQILVGRSSTITKAKNDHVPSDILLRKLYTLRHKVANSLQTWDISPIYALHDIMGKILEGLGRLLRGEVNRKWE